MALTKERKAEIIAKHGKSSKNTGSSEVQIALLSRRILDLTQHLKKNPKDFACRRGLLMLVGKRRRLLNYYKNTVVAEQYKDLIVNLGIRK
ncbi:MAG: 30S ribosomal protein S15 [Candidatus Melainabacteria bacterium]|nr:30S ribosomal protein S15 [Candidatus Melainabacteria bacterium]